MHAVNAINQIVFADFCIINLYNNNNINNNVISICIVPFARGCKALLLIITVSGKSSQSFRFT